MGKSHGQITCPKFLGAPSFSKQCKWDDAAGRFSSAHLRVAARAMQGERTGPKVRVSERSAGSPEIYTILFYSLDGEVVEVEVAAVVFHRTPDPIGAHHGMSYPYYCHSTVHSHVAQAHRIISQVVVTGARVFGRAFAEAYKQASASQVRLVIYHIRDKGVHTHTVRSEICGRDARQPNRHKHLLLLRPDPR